MGSSYRDAMTQNPQTSPPATRRSPFGMPVLALFGLAALALPRVILHDLRLIDPGGVLTWILAIGPMIVWIVVAVVRRVPNPFLTLLLVGAIYGALSVIIHQLLWVNAFAGDVPSIGGPAGSVVARVAAVPSGLITGAVVGAITGLIAWGISAITRRRGRS